MPLIQRRLLAATRNPTPWAVPPPPPTNRAAATFAPPPADTTTTRPPLLTNRQAPPAAPVATRPRPVNRLSADAARAQLGGRPTRNEGESIGSFNQRLGRFHRQFSNLTTGTTARDRAQLANAFAAQGNEADAQLAWWNGPEYFDASQLPQGYQGGAGGAGGGGSGAGDPAESQDFDSLIEQAVRGIMGGQTRFTPEVMATLEGRAASDTAGALRGANEAANLQAQATGNLYSGSTAETTAENTRQAGAHLALQKQDLQLQKLEADWTDKLAGLDRALALSDQRRQERLAQARNAIEVQRINAEMDIERQKLAAAKEAADGQARAEMASGRAWREHELAKLNLQREWDLENRSYEEPFRVGQFAAGL